MNRIQSFASALLLTTGVSLALGDITTVEVPLFFGNLSVPRYGDVPAGNSVGSLMVGVRGIGYDTPETDSLRAYNSYFVFDLTRVAFGPVTSAALEVRHGYWGHASGWDEGFVPGHPETVELFDVSTDSGFLRNPSENQAAFKDLESGTSYGATSLMKPENPASMASLTLNSAGIAEVQTALGSGEFRVGATLLSIINSSYQIEGDYMFAPGWIGEQLAKNSLGDVRLVLGDAEGNQLLVMAAIPEPLPVWSGLFLLGVVAVIRYRHRATD